MPMSAKTATLFSSRYHNTTGLVYRLAAVGLWDALHSMFMPLRVQKKVTQIDYPNSSPTNSSNQLPKNRWDLTHWSLLALTCSNFMKKTVERPPDHYFRHSFSITEGCCTHCSHWRAVMNNPAITVHVWEGRGGGRSHHKELTTVPSMRWSGLRS